MSAYGKELARAGVSLSDLAMAGASVGGEEGSSGYTTKLREAGVPVAALKAAGLPLAELKAAG